MRQIVLYEFTCSGGLWRQDSSRFDESSSLVCEGRAMLQALAADFAAIEGVQPIVMQDSRLADLQFEGCKVCDVASANDEESLLRQLSSGAEATMIVAPETDGWLLQRRQWIEESGGRLLNASSATMRLTSDKHRTAEHLASQGVPVPDGVVLRNGDPLPQDFSYPAVLKPIAGCGSQGVRWIADPSEICNSIGQFDCSMRLERFVPGTSASVAFLCGPRVFEPLVACRQHLSNDERFQYLGGSLPLPAEMATRATELAIRAVRTLPHPIGYIGVDLVLGDAADGSGDAVIEINPRLTTSYIGLRAAAKCNLAEAMWAIAEGRAATVSFGDERIEFDGDGTVRQVVV